MGEAKRRRGFMPPIVYHHTSQIRTNLIWMSGQINREGESKGAQHPLFGEIMTDVAQRRACEDFPPLVWFSSSTTIPRCLIKAGFLAFSKDDGRPIDFQRETGMSQEQVSNFMALKRFALGFPYDPATFTPWRDHAGYTTREGRDLNRSARDAGDNPDMWFVAEAPVDMMNCTEVWASRSIFNPRLESIPQYLPAVHQMVQLCRDIPQTYIPPSWVGDPVVEPMVEAARSRGTGPTFDPAR